ncbi:MAG: hypothetical protein H0X02_12955 [Nitrosomonas sp.]|nr:hypothetical protein [Nitrosomonas sp.]
MKRIQNIDAGESVTSASVFGEIPARAMLSLSMAAISFSMLSTVSAMEIRCSRTCAAVLNVTVLRMDISPMPVSVLEPISIVCAACHHRVRLRMVVAAAPAIWVVSSQLSARVELLQKIRCLAKVSFLLLTNN